MINHTSVAAGLRGLALATLLAAISTLAPAQETEFRIGAVGTLSGPFGVLGESIRKGAELAAEMRGNKVLGVPIKFVWEDDETKPQVAVQKATRLISGGAQMLLAPVSSGSTLAVMKLVERSKMPLLVTLSAGDDITGKDKNPYTFRTSNSADMGTRMMAAAAHAAGVKKIYIACMDYSAGREAMKILRSRLEGYGIVVVAEEYYAIGTKDYSVLVNKMLQSDADGVVSAFGGNDAINFFKQADEVGLQRKKAIFGDIVMDELIAAAVGQASLGVNSTMRYHFSTDNAANRAFVKAYRAKFNEFPDQYAGEAFDGVGWFLDVVDSTKSWDKERWLKAFRTSVRSNSVEGAKRMRSCDNQAEQSALMGKAVTGGGDLPPITMKITQRFDVSQLFKPCP
ncbi:MAG: ABC transporter substrate-binding protein [Pseudomonadota bacterium]